MGYPLCDGLPLDRVPHLEKGIIKYQVFDGTIKVPSNHFFFPHLEKVPSLAKQVTVLTPRKA